MRFKKKAEIRLPPLQHTQLHRSSASSSSRGRHKYSQNDEEFNLPGRSTSRPPRFATGFACKLRYPPFGGCESKKGHTAESRSTLPPRQFLKRYSCKTHARATPSTARRTLPPFSSLVLQTGLVSRRRCPCLKRPDPGSRFKVQGSYVSTPAER